MSNENTNNDGKSLFNGDESVHQNPDSPLEESTSTLLSQLNNDILGADGESTDSFIEDDLKAVDKPVIKKNLEKQDSNITIEGDELQAEDEYLKEEEELYHWNLENPEARPVMFKSTFSEVCAVAMLALCPTAATLMIGLTQVAVPTLQQRFNVSDGVETWFASAFALTSGSFVLLMSCIADNFGRKRVLLVGLIGFALFSLILGFAQSAIMFDSVTGVMGVFSAMYIPASVGIIGSAYPPSKRKNIAMACYASGAPIGFILGITISGICTQFISWRANFWFVAIVYGLILAPIAAHLIPNSIDPKLDRKEMNKRLKAIDYVGAILTIVGFGLFTFALTQAEATSLKWRTPYVIALLVIGIVIIIVFVIYEAYVPKKPLMPMHIWMAPNFGITMLIIAASWMGFAGVLDFQASIYFQTIKSASPMLNTAYFVPEAITGMCMDVLLGLTMHLIPGRYLMRAAMIAFVGSSILWAFSFPHMTYWATQFPALILAVVGAELSYNVGNMVSICSVKNELKSTAGGIFNTVAQLATTLGLAIGGAISASKTSQYPHPTVDQKWEGLRAAFWFATGTSATALLLSLFLKLKTTSDEAVNDRQVVAVVARSNGEYVKGVLKQNSTDTINLDEDLDKDIV